MKRRADRILEKLNLNNAATTEFNVKMDTKISNDPSHENYNDSKNTRKENIPSNSPKEENLEQSNTSMLFKGNEADNFKMKETSSTHSSSIIENSPDRSVQFDLNTLPLYSQISKTAQMIDEESKDTQKTLTSEKDQKTRSRDSSSDSSSSSSSSSSTSRIP
ncbi:uncharacterized protein [Choristoneura fumiferana]|uniref:uncharacterized protein n=1 Tax=Choristoneura fumiferana TaxID=7141 RepID=UPI003D1580C1